MDAFEVAHVHAALAVYRNGIGGAELAGLIPNAAKAADKSSIGREDEDGFGITQTPTTPTTPTTAHISLGNKAEKARGPVVGVVVGVVTHFSVSNW